MKKRAGKISVRIIIAVALGLVFASSFTHLKGPCTVAIQGEDITRCIEFSKAVMHPRDLLNNKQNSLILFTENFVIVSGVCFTLLTVYNRRFKRG